MVTRSVMGEGQEKTKEVRKLVGTYIGYFLQLSV